MITYRYVKEKERVEIYIDGKFSFYITEDFWKALTNS